MRDSRPLRSLRTGLILLALCSACSTPPAALVDSGPADATGSAADRPADRPTSSSPVLVLQVEADLPAWLLPRLEELLRGSTTLTLTRLAPDQALPALAPGSLVLSLGETAGTERLIGDAELSALAPDGFILRSAALEGGGVLLAGRGRANPDHFGLPVNRGALYAAYAALEELGFAFLHPLAPLRPRSLRLPEPGLDQRAAPRWRIRGMHIHTMHPTELADLLNGWGPAGTGDQAGFEQGLAEWRLVCEWLVASRQNFVEWVLLAHQSWSAFSESSERQRRLGRLAEVAHQYGLAVGVDTSLAMTQQHAFRLVRESGTQAEEEAQIRQRLDWLLGAGFDFINTENAMTEFTTGDDQKMLAWMNEFARHLESKGKKAYIKVHCSQGLVAKSFTDPRTGEPLNFNFLPHYAVPSLGVLPHSVQHYGLDDPAPTYGTQGFGFMRDFLALEAGRREVLWHPETAYWVSFDADVPLFLPLYAERRLHDLRLLAADEEAGRLGRGDQAGARMTGQVFFSSGWEWGYWLGDLVTARAAFDPGLGESSDQTALRALLGRLLRNLGDASQVSALADLLASVTAAQHRLLVLGEVNGVRPVSVDRLNGQAYLQGWESFDDLGWLVAGIPGMPQVQTQPNRVGLVDMRNPLHGGPSYQELRPLLASMASTLGGHAESFARLTVSEEARPILEELQDASRVTALRARQVLGLYDYVDGLSLLGTPSAAAKASLADARLALDEAQQRVLAREKSYRVPAGRVAGWRPGPTAYDFGYLWTTRSLHYFWRDEVKAVQAPLSPCLMNLYAAADVAFGEGFLVDNTDLIASALDLLGLGSALGDCLTAPATEPSYPPAGLRP